MASSAPRLSRRLPPLRCLLRRRRRGPCPCRCQQWRRQVSSRSLLLAPDCSRVSDIAAWMRMRTGTNETTRGASGGGGDCHGRHSHGHHGEGGGHRDGRHAWGPPANSNPWVVSPGPPASSAGASPRPGFTAATGVVLVAAAVLDGWFGLSLQ